MREKRTARFAKVSLDALTEAHPVQLLADLLLGGRPRREDRQGFDTSVPTARRQQVRHGEWV